MSDTTLQAPATPDERKLNLVDHALVLIVICAIDLVVNAVNHEVGFLHNLTGMVVLYAICMAGLVLTRIMPFYLPSVAWISLVGMAATLPFVPGSDWVVAQVTAIDFLALTTPTLAYAGFAIAREFDLEGLQRCQQPGGVLVLEVSSRSAKIGAVQAKGGNRVGRFEFPVLEERVDDLETVCEPANRGE